MPWRFAATLLALCVIGGSSGPVHGVTIANTGTVTYEVTPGTPLVRDSNEVLLETLPPPSPARVEFYQYAPGIPGAGDVLVGGASCSDGGGGLAPVPPLATFAGQPIDLGPPVELLVTGVYHAGEPVFLLLADASRNADPGVAEYADVRVTASSGDEELLRLRETGADSGVFAGGVQSVPIPPDAVAFDCRLSVSEQTALLAEYVDPLYPTDVAQADALVDPLGFVFDSSSGAVVDGATVELVLAASGLPATVFGDDGVSTFPSSVTSGGAVTDGGGTLHDFPPGGFRFPAVAPGSYRLVVTPAPAHTAPSLLEPAALAGLRDPAGAPYAVTAGSFADAFTVAPGPALNLDVPVDPLSSGALVLDKLASRSEIAVGDFVQYTLTLRNSTGLAATGVTVRDTLPPGFRFQSGSLHQDGAALADPAISADGRRLSWTVASLPAGAVVQWTYVVAVTAGAQPGDAVNRAGAVSSAGATSNFAEARVRVREPFFGSCALLIGRVVEGGCATPWHELRGVPDVRLVLEDGTYTTTDADGQFHFEGVCDGTHVVQLDRASLPPTHEPEACLDNTRFAGRDFSQFVDLRGGTLWRTDFWVRRKTPTMAPVVQVPPDHAARTRARREIQGDATAAGSTTDWSRHSGSGTEWLFPPAGHNPRAPALRVVLRHPTGHRVALRVNGREVEPISFDGTENLADGSASISHWRGIPIADGGNRLEAHITDPAGAVTTLERVVHYANQPVAATIVPEESVLTADGVTRPVLAVRLVDRHGQPVRAGVTGPFVVRPPYVAWQRVEREQSRTLAGIDRFQTTYEIEGDRGLAYIELEPTTQSGTVTLDFTFEDERMKRQQELEAWLEPAAREWIVVGFAEGTVGHTRLSGNMTALEATDQEEDVYTDGQVSFHAKGRVRGSWLLTLAYDSDEPNSRAGVESLLGVIDPDEFYTIYGDRTEQRYDAPSRENLYVRLEKRQFYALFGDYETGLTRTELTRYSRVLNGLKSEFSGKRVRFTAFGSDTELHLVRDEMQGDGTSGLYRLSRGRLVVNGESIRLETRDRYQSQLIVEARSLARHLDYDVDHAAGTLRFREPIPSRDARLNPVFIVAEYEVEEDGESEINAGGRVALGFAGERGEAGLTALRDERASTTTELAGLDIRFRPGPQTEVRVEAAGSRAETGTVAGDGAGLIAEVEHHDGRADALLWVRRVDEEFGAAQLGAAERGNLKVGGLGRWRFAEDVSLEGELQRQENLSTEVTRDGAALRLDWEQEDGALTAGARVTRDEEPGGERHESNQVVVGARREFLDDRLDLEARGEIAVGGSSEVADQPTRYLLQGGWDLTPDARLLLAQEIYTGEATDGSMTRVGIEADLWQGARVRSTLNQNVNEHGPRTFALFGLNQALLVGKRWGVDFGLDHNRTLHESGLPLVIDEAHPLASGGHLSRGGLTEDFSAVSAGATYRAPAWSWNGRLEWRDGEVDDRRGFVSSFLREAQRGVAFAIGLEASAIDLAAGSEGLAASIDLSWAHRPLGRRVALLDRLEFRYETLEDAQAAAQPDLLGATSLRAAGDARARALINNFNLNRVSRAWEAQDRRGNLFQLVERNQWSLYYGSKYVFDRYDGIDYAGYTDLLGLEVRHDLRRSLDVGAQASVLQSWESGTREYSVGPSFGFSPLVNAWITVGYNLDGFRDDDFDAARYTAEGPWVKLRFKFDETTRLAPQGGER